MRVNHSGNAPVQGAEVSGAKQSGKSAAANAAKQADKGAGVDEAERTTGRGGVRTEISPKSKEFAHAKAVATEAPDVREDRVADLKKRIADGNYSVDTNSIADRMVDEHLRMAGIR